MRHLARTVPGTASPGHDLVIVWDSAVLDERRYARLVVLLGDLVRAEGGIGIERVRSAGFKGEIFADDEP